MTSAGAMICSLIYLVVDFHKTCGKVIFLKPLLLCQIELKLASRFRSYKEGAHREHDGVSLVSLRNWAKNMKS